MSNTKTQNQVVKTRKLDRTELNDLSNKIIGISISIHKELGPGFVEKIYEKALLHELKINGIAFKNQKVVKVNFRDIKLGRQRLDFIIENEIVVELKSVPKILNLFKHQLLSYLKTEDKRLGLILNFGKEILDIKRVVNNF